MLVRLILKHEKPTEEFPNGQVFAQAWVDPKAWGKDTQVDVETTKSSKFSIRRPVKGGIETVPEWVTSGSVRRYTLPKEGPGYFTLDAWGEDILWIRVDRSANPDPWILIEHAAHVRLEIRVHT